ncbi:hypothetical protein ACN47E_007979 [Coniothyrium glycines]
MSPALRRSEICMKESNAIPSRPGAENDSWTICDWVTTAQKVPVWLHLQESTPSASLQPTSADFEGGQASLVGVGILRAKRCAEANNPIHPCIGIEIATQNLPPQEPRML